MTVMQINGSETGTVRLFHLDLPREAVERFVSQAGTGEWPLKYALGAKALRPGFVDVIDLRDLDEMPLSQYLAEAHGVTAQALKPMQAQIDALGGHVVILPSQAFDATSQDLTVASPLRWIGTFEEVRAKPRGPQLRSDSAKGRSSAAAAPPGRGSSAMLKMILIGIGIVAVLVIALALR